MLPLATSIMHIQVLIHTSVFSYTTAIATPYNQQARVHRY